MADSSTAHEHSSLASPSSPPSSARPQEHTPQNITAAAAPSSTTIADESTPLLANNGENSAEDVEPRSRTSSLLHRLTVLSLGCSVAFLALYLAISIVIGVGSPRYHVPYSVQDDLTVLLIFAVLSTLYSSLEIHRTRSNLRPLPAIVSLLFGLVTGLVAISYGASILRDVADGYGWGCGSYGSDDCPPSFLAIRILAILMLCAALLLGAVQAVMLFIRCRMAYRNGFSQESWRFPSGQLTLEFTIKFLREPERVDQRERSENGV